MALPKTVVEQLSRRPTSSPGVFGQLIIFSALIFIISIGAYFALTYLYAPTVQARLDTVNKDLDTFSKKISSSTQAQVIAGYSQAANITKLISQHAFPSALFNWIEKNTIDKVYFPSVDFRYGKSYLEVRLLGQAPSMNDIIAQVKAFQGLPDAKAVDFKGSSFSPKGVWDFEIDLSVDPALLKHPAPAAAAIPSQP